MTASFCRQAKPCLLHVLAHDVTIALCNLPHAWIGRATASNLHTLNFHMHRAGAALQGRTACLLQKVLAGNVQGDERQLPEVSACAQITKCISCRDCRRQQHTWLAGMSGSVGCLEDQLCMLPDHGMVSTSVQDCSNHHA